MSHHKSSPSELAAVLPTKQLIRVGEFASAKFTSAILASREMRATPVSDYAPSSKAFAPEQTPMNAVSADAELGYISRESNELVPRDSEDDTSTTRVGGASANAGQGKASFGLERSNYTRQVFSPRHAQGLAPVSESNPVASRSAQASEVALDLVQALDNLGGDHELLCEIAKVFVEDVPKLAVDLRKAYDIRDYRACRLVAHSLKGLCATFGAEPARSYAQVLEQSMVDVQALAVSGEQIKQLTESLEETIRVLDRDVSPKCASRTV